MFSGHDTTLQPFLAAVLRENWDGHWPGYAAMISIEVYRAVGGTSYLFRIVYNGQAMLVPGCDDTLCELNTLLGALSFGQEYPDCAVHSAASSSSGGKSNSTLSTADWIMITALSLLLGALIGAAAVVFIDKQRLEGRLMSLPLLEDGGSYQEVTTAVVEEDGTRNSVL